MAYEYRVPKDKLDYRAQFINDICGMVLFKHNNPELFMLEMGKWVKQFDECIKNAYELYSTETPLVGLWELNRPGRDAEYFDFTEEEYQAAKNSTAAAVSRMYFNATTDALIEYWNLKPTNVNI